MLLPCAGMVSLLIVAAPSYSSVRERAEPVPNLGRFLEKYVGQCDSNDPAFDKKGCETEAATERRRWDDKVLLIDVESPGEQLQFAEWDTQRQAFRLHLAPFFGERALALSVGKPERLSKDGLPVVKNVPIWVKLPAGEAEFAFRRQLERGMVRLELLVRPKRAWQMKRKNEDGEYRGVDVALVGVRVYPMRGQNVLAEQTY